MRYLAAIYLTFACEAIQANPTQFPTDLVSHLLKFQHPQEWMELRTISHNLKEKVDEVFQRKGFRKQQHFFVLWDSNTTVPTPRDWYDDLLLRVLKHGKQLYNLQGSFNSCNETILTLRDLRQDLEKQLEPLSWGFTFPILKTQKSHLPRIVARRLLENLLYNSIFGLIHSRTAAFLPTELHGGYSLNSLNSKKRRKMNLHIPASGIRSNGSIGFASLTANEEHSYVASGPLSIKSSFFLSQDTFLSRVTIDTVCSSAAPSPNAIKLSYSPQHFQHAELDTFLEEMIKSIRWTEDQKSIENTRILVELFQYIARLTQLQLLEFRASNVYQEHLNTTTKILENDDLINSLIAPLEHTHPEYFECLQEFITLPTREWCTQWFKEDLEFYFTPDDKDPFIRTQQRLNQCAYLDINATTRRYMP